MGAAFAALILTGCKPTERGYQQAYDAALQKREEAAREQMLPASGLLSDDGPQLRVVDGDSIYVLRERMFREGEKTPVKGWSVAVGQYKMATNARSGAAALRAQGLREAYAARVNMERWYVIAATVSTLDSARTVQAEFKRLHPRYPYIGLPASPILINY